MSHPIFISKLIRGLQCDKLLWFLAHNPPPIKLSPVEKPSYNQTTVLKREARQLFPDADEVPFTPHNTNKMAEITREKISNGTGTIFNAAFQHNNLVAIIDILKKGEDGWHIYLVKGTTKVRRRYIDELVMTFAFFKDIHISVSKVFLIYINKEYIRKGELDLNQVFSIADLTKQVTEDSREAKAKLNHIWSVFYGKCPSKDIGLYCTIPGPCKYMASCWSHIPKNSVFDLTGKGVDKFDCYKKGYLHFCDIPRSILSINQRMQVDAQLLNKTFTRPRKIKQFLKSLFFPIYFLDFETYQTPIPQIPGFTSYEQIPFQYSLHYREDFDKPLIHYEFLAEPGRDPREKLIKKLCEHIKDDSCIVVYNVDFEKMILEKLAQQFPSYKEKINRCCLNLRDLMVPFRQRDYYVKEMKGRYSLKNVLPALFPSLTYSQLCIGNGQDAMNSYMSLLSQPDILKKEKIMNDLLAYCAQDTFALVKIVERLFDVVSK